MEVTFSSARLQKLCNSDKRLRGEYGARMASLIQQRLYAGQPMSKKYPFQPDYAVPPGTTLKEVLEDRGISQSEFEVRTGMAEKTISQIINGIAPITYETAEKFELALSIPANFWNRREMSYREAIARKEAMAKMEEEIAWLSEIPVKELKERKILDEDASKPERRGRRS